MSKKQTTPEDLREQATAEVPDLEPRALSAGAAEQVQGGATAILNLKCAQGKHISEATLTG